MLTETKRNRALRIALIMEYDTQRRAAAALKMHESELSRIVSGWLKPSQSHIKKFQEVFGVRRTEELLFGDVDQ